MSLTIRQALVLVLIATSLPGCIETRNVSTFANSVLMVTDATDKIMASDRLVCADITALVQETESLPGVGSLGDANCAKLDKILAGIVGVNQVLGNYGQALADIAQDSFINYDSDVGTLSGILNQLPPRLASPEQIAAVGQLAGFVASLATEHDREKAIRAAMAGPAMQGNFHQVSSLLKSLAKQYGQGLEQRAATTNSILRVVRHDFGPAEPVAVAELSLRLAPLAHVSEAQTTALRSYQAALDGMDKAFDAALAKPTAKQLLDDVKDFARQARSVAKALATAFPRS